MLWVTICALSAAVVELMAGLNGWYVPCFALVAFYFLVTCEPHRVVWVLAITGLLLDLYLDRCAPATVLLLGPLCVLAALWRQHGDCVVTAAQFVPGMLVGAVTGFTLTAMVRLPTLGLAPGSLLRAIGALVILTLVGGLLLPTLCAGLDCLAGALCFEQYRQAQDEHGRTP